MEKNLRCPCCFEKELEKVTRDLLKCNSCSFQIEKQKLFENRKHFQQILFSKFN